MTLNKNKLNRTIGTFLAAVLFLATVAPTNVLADIAGTGAVVAEESAELNREHLLQELGRDEVRADLERYGVDPDEASERVAALTDEEIGELAADFEGQPAGADIGLTTILLLVLIYLLVR
ncbi:MAG: PA2779 family protein [Pseudomonadota bacterium]